MDLSNICEGCLSADRQLSLINNEQKSLFCETLDYFEYLDKSILLCWECSAVLKKIISFRKQVKEAHKQLIQCVLNRQLQPLSTLSTTTTKVLDNRESTSQQQDTQLMFIKVEDGMEACFVDGLDDRSNGSVDHNDLKTVLKQDLIEFEVPIKTKLKSKKTKKKTKEDFDESDEEPLKNKKKESQDSEVKHRGRREKMKEDGPKVDGRKHPRPKKERPAGVINNPRVLRKLQQLNVASGQLEMVALSWEEVEEERRKALNSVVFTRHEYRCYDCVLGFNHRFKLDNHMKKHHPSAGEHVCGVCKVRCRDAHALCAHRRRHRVRWRCCSCGAAWSRAAVAADHAARAHAAARPAHACALCGHCEPTLSKLRIHVKVHGERQKCELCGKTFRDKTSLRTHLFIHRGEKEYSCPRCEKRFLFKKAMEVHLVTHEESAHLYCYQCDMNFKNKMSYYQHMKYNLKHVDPAKLKYACSLCDKKFVKATRLEEHNLAVHLKVTPINCPQQGCHFACSSRAVLRAHARARHAAGGGGGGGGGGGARRDHVCHTCGKAYTTKKTLEGHMRSHTGERPFKCTQCPSTFGYEAALYNHNKLVHLKAKGRTRPPAPAPAAWPPPLNIQQNTADLA